MCVSDPKNEANSRVVPVEFDLTYSRAHTFREVCAGQGRILVVVDFEPRAVPAPVLRVPFVLACVDDDILLGSGGRVELSKTLLFR